HSLTISNSSATPYASPLSLHDALPILSGCARLGSHREDQVSDVGARAHDAGHAPVGELLELARDVLAREVVRGERRALTVPEVEDRKSTRLNSSHVEISYAVFCLK